MKLPNINKRHLAAAMPAIAALMLLDSLYQVGMHIRWRYWIPASLAVEIPSTQPASSQPAGSQPATQPTSQPAATQSASSQSTSTQAAASQAAATQTTSSQPSTTQAAASQSAATQAATSQSASSQPTATAVASGKPGNSPGSPPGAAAAAKPPKPHELAAAIKKRNIMAEPKPTGHGLSLAGVLDNVAFFRNREGKDVFIEEGKSGDGGVKVKSIDGTDVTIEYEGKPETMKLFSK